MVVRVPKDPGEAGAIESDLFGQDRGRLEDHRREPILQGSNAAKHRQSQRVRPSGSRRQADEEGKPSLESDTEPESLRWASDTLRDAVATRGGHRLGDAPDKHSRAEGRASRRLWYS